MKVPLKINHFIWKLLHNSLPTFLNLKQRGISLDPTCPLCHEEDEASTHLLLLCPLARACWHRSSLAIHASDYANISIQHWLNILLTRHNLKFPDSMDYLQALFTYLWTMWTHRNKVVHDGITPNPMQVILMAQSLSCRYKEAFTEQSCQSGTSRRPAVEPQSAAGPWQLIIKVAGSRNKKKKRRAYAYEAINPQGVGVFVGVNSSTARTATGCLLEAVVEASLTAIAHNFQRVLFVSDCGGLVRTLNNKRASDWQDTTKLADLSFLVQGGFLYKVILVPPLLVNYISAVAKQATLVPFNQCWLNPALYMNS